MYPIMMRSSVAHLSRADHQLAHRSGGLQLEPPMSPGARGYAPLPGPRRKAEMPRPAPGQMAGAPPFRGACGRTVSAVEGLLALLLAPRGPRHLVPRPGFTTRKR